MSSQKNSTKPVDGTTIALIAIAISFGALLIAIVFYFVATQARKRRRRAQEVKESKFKLGHQYEIQISSPTDPSVVTPSDIYMNYY